MIVAIVETYGVGIVTLQYVAAVGCAQNVYVVTAIGYVVCGAIRIHVVVWTIPIVSAVTVGTGGVGAAIGLHVIYVGSVQNVCVALAVSTGVGGAIHQLVAAGTVMAV